ncbi:estradiol 17-beta-dehydrogenase 8-like isoform X1 [Biomphalaria glabrata]|nr:estradiol 17-beta-dehydrogenase 8-like isoform X1 [Biomphalaria glabrata]
MQLHIQKVVWDKLQFHIIYCGGSGIGKAVCSVLAREGARVAVTDINKSSAQETVLSLPNSSLHEAFEINVSSSTEVTNLLENIEKRFKSVPCIAVHAAGITRDNFLLKLDEQSFDEVINVNLKGTFLINQAVGRAMQKARIENGSIVNISSIVGKNGNVAQTNYAASKAGVIGFTKSAAKELARYNIRVNAILPGFIETPMTEKVPENIMQMITALIPLKRTGQPQEIAEVCAFLVSPKSSYITGEAIEVTGGLNF